MAQFKPHSLLTGTSIKQVFTPAVIPVVTPGISNLLSRGSSVEERGAHNPEVEGATPSPATTFINPNIIPGYN